MISEVFFAVQSALYEQANSGNYIGVFIFVAVFAFGPGIAGFIASQIRLRVVLKAYNRTDERTEKSYDKHLEDMRKELDKKQEVVEMLLAGDKKKEAKIQRLIKQNENLKQ